MTRIILSLFLTLFFLPVTVAHAHQHGDKGSTLPQDVKILDISNDIKVIQAGGGNIAVLKGPQGLFLVDNGLADKADAVMDAVKSISDQPVKIIANTHWHYDHVGNNAAFSKIGATLIAHDNVRKRLVEGGTIEAFGREMEPAESADLPVLTYGDTMSVHLNNKEATVMKMPNAHTDGDSIIFWESDNIIHTGDLFFNGFWPFIDASSGGSLRGMIKANDKILSMVNNETKIIPGHGPMATKQDLEAYNAMLKDLARKIKSAKEAGETKADWSKSEPLKSLDEKWGGGFLPTQTFTSIVWDAY